MQQSFFGRNDNFERQSGANLANHVKIPKVKSTSRPPTSQRLLIENPWCSRDVPLPHNSSEEPISSAVSNIKNINGIKFLHLNAQSCVNKLDEIRLLVLESNPDFLGISETWLHDGIDSSEINIPNYELLRKDRDDRHGGVAIYFHSRLEVNQVHLPNIHCVKLETLWIKLKLPNTRPIYTGIVYGPIICNKFFEELEVVFDEVICLGDFNCDSLKPNDWQWKKLHGIMSTRQLSQIISKPTRLVPQRN